MGRLIKRNNAGVGRGDIVVKMRHAKKMISYRVLGFVLVFLKIPVAVGSLVNAVENKIRDGAQRRENQECSPLWL